MDPILPTEPFEVEEHESQVQQEFDKVKTRLAPLFEHGGVGDDEMIVYLGFLLHNEGHNMWYCHL